MKSNNKNPKIFYFIVSFFFVVYVLLVAIPCSISAIVDTATDKDIYLMIGELESLKVYSLTRISMVDPSIADITNATDSEIELIGQKVGQTALFIWDQQGKRSIIVHVCAQDLDIAKARMRDLFAATGIHEVTMETNENEGKIILKGDLPEEKQGAFNKIIASFKAVIFNLVNEEELKDLVQIDMEIIELSSTFNKALGIDWNDGGGIALNYDETLPATDGSIPDFFKIGQFNRTNAMSFGIDALIEEGKGKLLSKPKLIVTNGEQASFLVGGEIPIRTTTTSEGSTTDNVSFKQYGVSFGITPTIKKVNSDTKETEQRKIDIEMNVEISDIDEANGVGEDVAFLTRSISTKLFLEDRQTIVMAGLIKTNEGENIKKIPYLWKIPVLGMLFQKKSMPAAEKETDLVITLTPTILIDGKESFDDAFDLGEKKSPAAPNKALSSGELEDEYMGIQEPKALSVDYLSKPAAPILSEDMKRYVEQVKDLIERSVVYPAQAWDSGWEGALKLELLLLQDGTLAFVYVKEPSAHKIFDEYALKAAKKIANYPNFPLGTDLQEVNVVVPIVYSLDNN